MSARINKTRYPKIYNDYMAEQMTVKEIAEKYGVCDKTVYNVVKAKGIPPINLKNRRRLKHEMDEYPKVETTVPRDNGYKTYESSDSRSYRTDSSISQSYRTDTAISKKDKQTSDYVDEILQYRDKHGNYIGPTDKSSPDNEKKEVKFKPKNIISLADRKSSLMTLIEKKI